MSEKRAESREDKPAADESRVGRRRALEILGGLTVCAASAPIAGLVSCGGGGSENAGVAVVRLSLDDLPAGGRLRVMLGDDPVELSRRGDEIVARSLWCTHWGCEVKWFEGDRVYRCPCHDGIYDETGKVLTGPPPRPLALLSARVEGREIVVERHASEDSKEG